MSKALAHHWQAATSRGSKMGLSPRLRPPFERTRVRAHINVEEHRRVWHKVLQLALDDGALVLAGAPNVAPATTRDAALGYV